MKSGKNDFSGGWRKIVWVEGDLAQIGKVFLVEDDFTIIFYIFHEYGNAQK